MKRKAKSKKNKNAAVIVAVVAVVAVIVVAAVLLIPMLNRDSQKTDTPSDPETTDTTDAQTTDTTVSEDTDNGEEVSIPEFFNPLTGLEAASDLSGQRPAAIMINNIKLSCPQVGIRNVDVLYECLAEGDITRLLALTSDYSSLTEIGSVRSARDYFLDFAQNHDALFVHAGGSPDAYTNIADRDIDNLDGVNMYLPDVFYRDEERRVNMGYEHSLMTDGKKIASGISKFGYRTEIKSDFDNPFDFVEYGQKAELLSATDAKHVYIPFSFSQKVDLIYNESTGTYDRYQFDGEPHIDGETGDQLSFTNIFILFCESAMIDGDEKYRITVDTVGSDTGYYITDGKVVKVNWTKADRDSEIKFTAADGSELKINRGKTYIAVVPEIRDKIEFNKAN